MALTLSLLFETNLKELVLQNSYPLLQLSLLSSHLSAVSAARCVHEAPHEEVEEPTQNPTKDSNYKVSNISRDRVEASYEPEGIGHKYELDFNVGDWVVSLIDISYNLKREPHCICYIEESIEEQPHDRGSPRVHAQNGFTYLLPRPD